MSQSLIQPKAVALISGGLDSMLATKLVLEQGVHVEGLNFFTGFCVEGHTHAIRNKKSGRIKRNNALWVAEQLGIKLHIIDVIEEYKSVVLNPKHGYGANLNPCLDCKGFMVGKAREWMEQHGFDFIVTGEVMGQRPKSQTKAKLPIVARESGAFDRLLRPLCAKLLEETLPEKMGWVDRSKLGEISGRSRSKQFRMAKLFNIQDYAQPAGGCCFLTDASYAKKLKDLWTHRESRDYDLDDIMLLKIGRHLRPQPHYKIVVARDEGESRFMRGYRSRFTHLEAQSHLGPLALVQGNPVTQDLETAARITARYGQGRDAEQVTVRVVDKNGAESLIAVKPMETDAIPKEWHV